MKRAELKKQIADYQSIAAQIADLEKAKEAIAEKIKKHMGENELEQIDNIVIRYQTITSRRFDTKEFQKSHERLYKNFLKTSTTKRFSITVQN